MNKLKRLLENAKKLDEKKFLFTIWSTKSVKEYIIELNRTDQLFKSGEYTSGNIVGTYSALTEQFNPAKKQGEHYDFFDTGEFFNSFEVEADKDGSFTIFANDSKDNGVLLEQKYDKGKLLGLNVPNLEKLVETVLPFFINETRDFLVK